MSCAAAVETRGWSADLLAQAEGPACEDSEGAELEWWPYRPRTVALLRRYARASIELGRLPSLLGREFFRSRLPASSSRTFEDMVVFVADMDHTLENLDAYDRKLLAMYVLQEYTISEISGMVSCSERTAERLLHDAIDHLSKGLVGRGLME